MDRSSKEKMVAELADQLANVKAAFLADYRGLNVEKLNQLRTELRNAGAEYRVVKNTLLRLAAKGTTVECLENELAGPTAMALATGDPVAPAKVLSDFAKANEKFQIKAGALEGKLLSVDDIKALADLPSREVLLGKMLGSLNAPVTNFVGVLAAVPRSLVQVLGAIQEKKAA
ncbi:50S ribosomal protein L10 [Geoalkalibacter halelectricus]|uniref:Large ribosomal subunit protein uL10 n=1 Tax=Geoalkalibacter halelectricus TaxID=2847045 RepID=A0ABY5ZK13_9BACT|nr:50S ribosomal protein L10 [Geoalkalibacter halelectricus]MDO3379066.1 50S ribosomal protein L10 [Geoalkalibacter halelectricus]UWZ78953.1 50S ribosomal protein L10 [Geoalkalibacter halelectricus]